ncbi:MAG: hypothetical protein ACRC0X_01070 [Brevinema sp.]
MVPKRKITKYNWLVMSSGLGLILLGYLLVAPITRDYETPKAFFAILTLNIGLLTVILGLSIPFESFFRKQSKEDGYATPISKKSN